MIVAPVQAALQPGTRIGPYEVEAPLGSGGMGEVYRARDGRLGRTVALKLLPARLATDADALSRFEQEARAASALSHPNVVTVFDVGQEGGRPWLAMELVPGDSLRHLLRRGPLPLRQALDLACQLADALAAAHARGIVHRDLKPENLMVADDGHLKVLDFGIAKLAGRSSEPATTIVGQHGVLPAAPEHHTEPGTILGTVGYLSPEQARGQPADARSDQFAFGAILYELLSGERAFGRDTAVDTLSAILREEPAPLPPDLAAAVPTPVLWVVQRCLAKQPRDRYASTLDLARDLRQVRDNLASLGTLSASAPVVSRRPPGPSRRSVVLGVAALVALAAAFAGGLLLAPRLRRVPGTSAARVAAVPALRYVSYSGRDSSPTLSRDGRLLAFVSERTGKPRIWVQVAGGRDAALTEGPDSAPRISPDGSSILFMRDEGARRSLYRVPLVGGPPRKVIDDAGEGDWSPDGRRIAFVRFGDAGGRPVSTLGTAAADGSEPRELARVAERMLRFPRWSPDGTAIAARVGPLQGQLDPELALFDARSGARRTLPVVKGHGQVYGLAWHGASELLYAEVSGATAGGSSRVMALDMASSEARTVFTLPGRIVSVDAAGARIATDVRSNRQSLRELPLHAASGGRHVQAGVPGRALTRAGAEDRQPAYSPDARWLVFSSNRTGNLDLWLLDTQSGEERQLTDDEADDWDPAFTPDGRSLLWSTNRAGHFEVWRMAVDGSGARQLTTDGADAENPTTADGGWVVYNSFHPTKGGIWKVRADGSGAVRLVAGATTLPEVSPDGRHVLFVTDYVGRTRGTLRVARTSDGAVVFSTSFPYARLNDGRPRWLPGGDSFAFVAQDDAGVSGVFVQPFAPGADTVAQRRPLAGFDPDAPAESFGISPDGRRLALSTIDGRSFLLMADAP
jgi:eukaryotic-like serine/threonine-protein kinase